MIDVVASIRLAIRSGRGDSDILKIIDDYREQLSRKDNSDRGVVSKDGMKFFSVQSKDGTEVSLEDSHLDRKSVV